MFKVPFGVLEQKAYILNNQRLLFQILTNMNIPKVSWFDESLTKSAIRDIRRDPGNYSCILLYRAVSEAQRRQGKTLLKFYDLARISDDVLNSFCVFL